MDSDPIRTQRDVVSAVVTQLRAAGFDDAYEIGRGGFGIVYRCTQVGLDRTVAIKVLTAELDENGDRFRREQRAMGRLTGHPNIVSVLQVGETENGYPYLVMQYHRHGSLEARIRQLGLLPLEEVLRLGVKMAGALETAHRLGIVHRDVKPGNILLTDYGEPALGAELQQVQLLRGLPVDEMARQGGAQSPQPQAPATSAASVGRTIGNLPLELTSFVGRRAELSAAKHMLSSSRLVTLTGIGGVGKTRLALRAATELATDFADGVWLVELGELRDGSLLVDVVATGLGVRDESARPLEDVLVEFVSARKLLLVLDNCEQVVDAVAKLTETLLRGCPELRIIATTREALGIGGEAVLRVAPLTFPGPEPETTLGGLPAYDAVALFAERAAAAVPGFELTNDNKATVARICSKLDGLPLAIELAAARLRALSPEQVLERLVDRYSLLTRGSRGAPTRQQTLSWSVGWSYDLCTPAEQQLWSRLSVFAGSFELEAAEDICNGDLAPEDILDLLSLLVDKSILTRTEHNGVVRFRLLETLRDYGREQILQGDRYPELRRRHTDWYRRMVSDAAADWV